ncbi:UDP-glucose 4-epimerase GalE [Gammaproteobacteria bacterium LSUCC0057]|uniref:UDP-glucose 4-epimerase n=1 Tax=Gammaproteobacteria bacterium LSUCC0057 TaxID=2559237 RepID=A0A4Y8UIC6_9GAMM|nr:UDP-glucose 4-epimerase GalE [Gammaproteobacteria bacterium LSUCC0057]
MKSILVTGGAGFIGSHIVTKLLESNYHVVVLDNFTNSSPSTLNKIIEILNAGGKFDVYLDVCEGDVNDINQLSNLFAKFTFECVIHLAGLKSVSESSNQPLNYYHNNVSATATLLQSMRNAGVFKFIFSSSATIYGETDVMPLSEDSTLGVIKNPYGKTKLIVEDMLSDLSSSDSRWSIAVLRYFNPVGAHKSGKIGENPINTPNNLFPYIMQVATGQQSILSVYGNDYPTHDGSGMRDYIHVLDLVDGHLATLSWLKESRGLAVWNLGTGTPYSVFEVISAFEKVINRKIPFKICGRRKGDVSECWANPKKARSELLWVAKRDLTEMVEDAWHWQTQETY